MKTFKEKVLTDADARSIAAEFSTTNTDCRIIAAEILTDGSCRLTFEIDDGKSDDVLIKASELSLDDDFMRHGPSLDNGRKGLLKKRLTEVIEKGIKDFYRPRIDPSLANDGNEICYIAGRKPAFGKTYYWWEAKAKAFNPERRSRLGTWSEYVAFLGVLIKTLVVYEGWSIDGAWNAVCNDSAKLGHYWNSNNAKFIDEPTGLRGICDFYDLANIPKILAPNDGESGFYIVSGGCYGLSYNRPLSYCEHWESDTFGSATICTGWLVYER